MKHLMFTAVVFLGTLISAHTELHARLIPLSEVGIAVPEHGSISQQPALRWEDAFVSGNGRMGAMMFGTPENEIFVANNSSFPCHSETERNYPDLAVNVPD